MKTGWFFDKVTSYLILALVFVLFTSGLLLGYTGRVRSAGPYVVNVSGDGPDSDTTDGICYWEGHGCSLRAAIEQASADGAPTSITFLGTLAYSTIYLDSTYGAIFWTGNDIIVAGESNNITISGEYLAPGQSIILISGNGNTIQNLNIKDSPWDGVGVGDFSLLGAGNNNVIKGNSIIGSTASGVYFYGGGSGGGHDNALIGNLIGNTSPSTPVCVPSEANQDGVYAGGVTLTNIITGNLITCNNQNGIHLVNSSHFEITANKIGTDGVHHLGNGTNGVLIEGAASQFNVIGGNSASSQNVISGNGNNGVMLNSAPDNTVKSNLIGLNEYGDDPINNQWAGVAVENSSNNTKIGYLLPSNLYISGNLREGIYAANSSNLVVGDSTLIGRRLDGSPAGNSLEGIKLDSGVTGAIINPGTVAYNGGAGIGSAARNLFLPWYIFQNGGLPIDLDFDGHTPNDAGGAGLGADGWLDFPVVTSVNGQLITGISCPNCRVYIRPAVGNPAANGGGYDGNYGYVNANGSGVWSFSLPEGVNLGMATLFAEGPLGSGFETSELSPRPVIYLPIVKK